MSTVTDGPGFKAGVVNDLCRGPKIIGIDVVSAPDIPTVISGDDDVGDCDRRGRSQVDALTVGAGEHRNRIVDNLDVIPSGRVITATVAKGPTNRYASAELI